MIFHGFASKKPISRSITVIGAIFDHFLNLSLFLYFLSILLCFLFDSYRKALKSIKAGEVNCPKRTEMPPVVRAEPQPTTIIEPSADKTGPVEAPSAGPSPGLTKEERQAARAEMRKRRKEDKRRQRQQAGRVGTGHELARSQDEDEE